MSLNMWNGTYTGIAFLTFCLGRLGKKYAKMSNLEIIRFKRSCLIIENSRLDAQGMDKWQGLSLPPLPPLLRKYFR